MIAHLKDKVKYFNKINKHRNTERKYGSQYFSSDNDKSDYQSLHTYKFNSALQAAYII